MLLFLPSEKWQSDSPALLSMPRLPLPRGCGQEPACTSTKQRVRQLLHGCRGKKALSVPGVRAGLDPRPWLFCYGQEQRAAAAVCAALDARQRWHCTLCPGGTTRAATAPALLSLIPGPSHVALWAVALAPLTGHPLEVSIQGQLPIRFHSPQVPLTSALPPLQHLHLPLSRGCLDALAQGAGKQNRGTLGAH